MPTLVRGFIEGNRVLSERFDGILSTSFSKDGYQTFLQEILPGLLARDIRLYDIGGGSLPCLSMAQKMENNITLIGVDIDAGELARAPEGLYDQTICADVSRFNGNGDGDLAVCLASLEHVRDVQGSMRSLSTIVRPGGRVALFVPCRNAMFARLNILLPQKLKERLLFSIFPETANGHQGFEAFYDACTPKQMTRLAQRHGFVVEMQRCFWMSSYFSFFFPLYLCWRLWTIFARTCIGVQAAETFVLILRRRRSS